MKKKMYVALAGVVLVLCSFTVAQNQIDAVVEKSLDQAIAEKVITPTERDQIVESGVINVAYETFFSTQGDTQATVNAVADKLVELGYFKSRAQAKAVARKTLDQIRHDDSLCRKAYSILGL